MKALARFGKAFGGYKMIDVPEPICGPDDIVIEIKAAAICGADMKHYNVDSGSDQFNSIRGHEFAGQIVRIGDKVKDWKVVSGWFLTTVGTCAVYVRPVNKVIFCVVQKKLI